MLAPIEAAIYWHMFDRLILQTGQQYCRVSTRGPMSGVVKSTKSGGLAIQESMRNTQAATSPSAPDEKKEGDFYNVPENRLRVFERDEYKCRYSGKQLTRFIATLDHLQPVSERGDNSFG